MIDPARVIVTGASGFIGAAVVRGLLRHGAIVSAWVHRDSARLDALRNDTRLQIAQFDLDSLLHPDGVPAAAREMTSFRPTALVHTAWRGIRGDARHDPAQIDNVRVTCELLQLLIRSGGQRFVGIGSQAEYGCSDHALSEDDATHPETLYGAAKLAAGHLSLALGRTLGASVAWLRAFSVYGPSEGSGSLVPDLSAALARGEDYPLSTCEQFWDYLYEDDAGEAIARMALTRASGVFNLASGSAPRLRETVTLIAQLSGADRPLLFGHREGPTQNLIANVDRVKSAIGWSPAVSLRDGLSNTVRAISDRMSPGT